MAQSKIQLQAINLHQTLNDLVGVVKKQGEVKHVEMDNIDKDNRHREHLKLVFIRTMRRLRILCKFAKNLGQDFNVDNMDIATLTKRKYIITNDEKIYQ